MRKINNPIVIAVFVVSSLMILSFQNCSQKGFSTGVGTDNSSVSPSPAPAAGGLAQEATASFEIAPIANDKLSTSGILSMMNKPPLLNFKEYVPQYPLYSDNATKRRFIYLPKDSRINTANPDEWIFPKGTIFWKEFSIDGKKVETRVWEKISESFGPTAWRPSLYVWKADQTEADLQTVDDFYTRPVTERQLYQAGLIETKYKMLKLSSCVSCHSSSKDVALGFNYLELSKRSLAVNIFTLKAQNLLISPPLLEDEIKGSARAQAAIGYMQTNCATCHNGVTNVHNFKHVSTAMNYADENVVKDISLPTPVGKMPLVTMNDLGNSRIYQRLVLREMPKINLFMADTVGIQLISDWITNPDVVVISCVPMQVSKQASPAVGTPGAYLISSPLYTNSGACSDFCKSEIAKRPAGSFFCQYVDRTATSNDTPICALTPGLNWSLATTGTALYSATSCSKVVTVP